MSTGPTGQRPTIISPVSNPGTGRWQPSQGREISDLVLPAGSRDRIIDEAASILSRCVSPNGPDGQDTGLVVGHVQSGKTMSFTTIAALARDNHFRMVIVIAGTKLNLLDQSRRRLIQDLRLETRTDRIPWRHIPDPRIDRTSHISIRNALADWDDQDVPSFERKTLLITVMKHHGHLQHLVDVLQELDLSRVPTLIIDDEADQAGLNTMVRRNLQSNTYSRILDLKRALPHHTYLQYTATPQANLLINIIDVLSPGFAEVLTPGAEYVGGSDFFTGVNRLVRIIPANEIPSPNNAVTEPPASLIRAMELFLLGVAAGLDNDDGVMNRSMMVHPSQRTDPQRQYFRWITNVMDQWRRVMDLQPDDPDRISLINQFRPAHADLSITRPDLPALDGMAARLRLALRRTELREVNSRAASTRINWRDEYSWILVGGQAMDRGFTVEGLTVTYMPRGAGMGMADTLQQRARFFGYKRRYLGFCRVFLENDVNDLFRSYVNHEEDMRAQLVDFRATGRPLTEWRRQLFLDRNLRPTRDNVLDIAYQRVRFGNDWVLPNRPHISDVAITANREVLARFRSGLMYQPHDGLDRRRGSLRNLMSRDVTLQFVQEELLTLLRFPYLDDSEEFAALMRLIQKRLRQSPDELADVYLMAQGDTRSRAYENGKIQQLFQGRQSDSQGPTYPGDRDVKTPDRISVQLVYLHLTEGTRGVRIADDVPLVAVWVPGAIAQDAIRQPQGGTT